MTDDLAEAMLNRTWRPALSVVGADGLTPISKAGNVLRPGTALKLSLRLRMGRGPLSAEELQAVAAAIDAAALALERT